MIRTHLIRMYPNKKQAEMLAKTAGVTRYCYNWGLAKWNEMHERGEKCDQYLLSRLWTKEKPEWAAEVCSYPPRTALLNLGGAFAAFFRGEKKHPHFHKKAHQESFCLANDRACLIGDKRIRLARIGDVVLAESLRFTGNILRYTVSRRAGFWYVGIVVDLGHNQDTTDYVENPVGVDVGSRHLAVASDGLVLNRPNSITKVEKRLKRYHHIMDRRCKGSRNHDKSRIKVARAYKRISDIKLDAVHKFTSQLVKSHDLVCCENLSVSGMAKSVRAIRKAVFKSCMGELRRQLSYKAKNYVEVDRFFPSSKRCSNCGHVTDDLKLSDRTYKCQACGAVLDRDFNASINLCKEGLRVYTEGHSGSACGGC